MPILRKLGLKNAVFSITTRAILQRGGAVTEWKTPSLLFWVELALSLLSAAGARWGSRSSLLDYLQFPGRETAKKYTFGQIFWRLARRKCISSYFLGDGKEQHTKKSRNSACAEFLIISCIVLWIPLPNGHSIDTSIISGLLRTTSWVLTPFAPASNFDLRYSEAPLPLSFQTSKTQHYMFSLNIFYRNIFLQQQAPK